MYVMSPFHAWHFPFFHESNIFFQLDPVLENVGVGVPSTRALINGGLQIWCLFVAVSE